MGLRKGLKKAAQQNDEKNQAGQNLKIPRKALSRATLNASITVVKNGHGLLNVQEILTIFWNDSQFVQQVCVEMDGVPSIVASVFSLPALALTGVVKLVDDVP